MCKTQKQIEAEDRKNIINRLKDNVFVEAGAGAGKTTLIVSRIINQLKQGMSPEGIVVITFTNAAAEELRSRITAKVRMEAMAEGLSSFEKTHLTLALQQLDLMKISTIHSFCFTLLKERIFDAKLPMDVKLMEEAETEEQKHRIFVEWASSLSEADWNLLTERGEKKADVMKQIESLYQDICELSEDTDIYSNRSLFGKNYDTKAKILVEDFEKIFYKEAGKLLGKTITNVSEIPESMLITAVKEMVADLGKAEIPYMKVLAFVAANPTGKKKYFNMKKAEIAKGADLMTSDMECRNWYEIGHRDEINTLLKEYEDCTYTRILDYAIKARTYYRSMRPLRYVSNDDLLQKTHHLICESEEARAYFAKKIDCLYVDEFQDTDHIQEEFIWKLCTTKEDENKLRDGVLFLVGDPKQSIYRFRGAEPEVYFYAKEKMSKLSNTKVYSLDNNYRSNEEIITWVNNSFRSQKISNDVAYRDMIFNRELPEQKEETLLTGVYYYNSPKVASVKLEADALRLAEMIDTLVDSAKITDYNLEGKLYTRPVNYADFLVLCYSKTDMDFYLKEMQKKGIPVKTVVTPDVKTYSAISHKLDAQVTLNGKKQDEPVYEKYSPSELETASETKKKVLETIDKTTIVKSKRPRGNVFGTAMHRGLELLIERWRVDFFQTPEQLSQVIRACVNQAVLEGRDDIKKNEVLSYQEFLLEILNTFAKWAYEEQLFTDDNVAEVYTEYNFSYAAEDMQINGKTGEAWVNGTADLMILGKDGSLKILDYKSDCDEYLTEEQFVCALKETYSGQLALYKKSMARLFGLAEDKISLGIFSFIEKETPGNLKIRYTQM